MDSAAPRRRCVRQRRPTCAHRATENVQVLRKPYDDPDFRPPSPILNIQYNRPDASETDQSPYRTAWLSSNAVIGNDAGDQPASRTRGVFRLRIPDQRYWSHEIWLSARDPNLRGSLRRTCGFDYRCRELLFRMQYLSAPAQDVRDHRVSRCSSSDARFTCVGIRVRSIRSVTP